MTIRKSSATLVVALVVAGCSSLSRDAAFHGEPGKGFVVISAEGRWQASGAYYFLVLRPLNTAKDGFIKHQSVAYFTGSNSNFPDDQFVKPSSTNPAIRVVGLHLVPGDYALVSLISKYGQSTYVTCYALGSAVYHIKEGVVNVVRFHANNDVPRLDPDTVKSDLAATLAAYPKITAPLDMAVPMGTISFTTSKNILGNPTCDPDGPLSFTPRPAQSTSAAQ